MAKRIATPTTLVVPILLAVGICLAFTAAGAETFGFDQLYYTPGVMGVVFENPAKRMAVALTLPPEMNGKLLASVKFCVQGSRGVLFPLVVELRNDDNGLPGSTILAQGSFTRGYSWGSAAMTPAFTVQSGVVYHIVVRPQSGCGNEDNNVRVCYRTGRFRPDMVQELNLSGAWFNNPHADPAVVLAFTDGTKHGQGYGLGTLSFWLFGSEGACRFGERIILSSPLLVRKVSFSITRTIVTTAPLRLVFREETSGIELVNEVFSLADDCTTGDPTLMSHQLTSPVTLEANKAYKIYLTQDSASVRDARYVVFYEQAESSEMSFGGANCYAFSETASGSSTPLLTADVLFRLDSRVLELVRSTLHLVTMSSAVLVAETNVPSSIQLDYGTSTSYGATIQSGPATLHEFHLSGLASGTNYHYRLRVTNQSDQTDVVVTGDRCFRTDPGSGTIDVCVVADTQSIDPNAIIRAAVNYPHDLILTAGDNVGLQELNLPNEPHSYYVGRREWRSFLRNMSPLTESAPLYTALGNHDASWEPQLLAAYRDSVVMPTNGNGAEQYYSFDYGPVHFVVIDNGSFAISSAQLNWLANDLAYSTKPWRIAILHVPLYGAEPNWTSLNPQAAHNVLRDGGVSLVIQGHRHAYNRYIHEGIYYVTNSTTTLWGNGAVLDGFEQGFTGFPGIQNSGGDPGTIAAYLSRPGWMQLNVSDTQIHGEFRDPLGRVLDGFTIPSILVLAFDPDGGQFSAPTSVSITCDVPDADIHYTTDGREPTIQDPTVTPGSRVPISVPLTLKAKAFVAGFEPGDTKSTYYQFKAATPTSSVQWISPAYHVTLSCATPNATIRYTLGGADPKSSDPVASGPIVIPSDTSTIVKARAWAPSMLKSDVATFTYGGRVLVRKGAPGPAHDGKTWKTAFLTINEAINQGILARDIWVAGSVGDPEIGTYRERLTLSPGQMIYGGFSGNETVRSQRDTTPYDTIIDGSGGGGGSVVTAPAEITSDTVLDGFILKNGSGKPINGYTYGGGLYCAGSPVINNLVISDNNSDYGGGIYCEAGASPNISNCQIIANTSTQQGGGIYVAGAASIRNNTIADNTAALDGGGVYSTGSPTMSNNVIAFGSSGIKRAGGAPILQNNCLYSNNAYNYSGLSAGFGDIVSDPKFSGRSYRNYRISSDSPCVDTANSSSAPDADADGNSRPVDGNSDGTSVADIGSYERAWKVATLPTARALKDHTPVSLFSGAVTAVLPDRFYVQASNRIGAIGVLGSGAEVGKAADIKGEIVTVDGEKMISASSVLPGVTATPPNPLALSLNVLGGGAFLRQQAVNGWLKGGQRKEGKGVTNIAMLVRCVGRVAAVGSGFFYLDDGSDVSEGNEATRGVRVDWPYVEQPPQSGSFIRVTAVSSCRIINVSGSDYIVRMLRPLFPDAVETIPLP